MPHVCSVESSEVKSASATSTSSADNSFLPLSMGIGDVFRSAGLSFADVGFVKFNAAFPAMVAVAHFGLTFFCSSTMSTTVMESLPGTFPCSNATITHP